MQDTLAHTVDRALRNPHSLTPLVLVMGFIGAALRYLLEMALPADGGFPAATLAVNIFGCFMLEIINQYVALRTKLPGPLVKSMGIGLIGAFTTIAALSTENLSFLLRGEYGLFALYEAITITSTFFAAYAGKLAADRIEGVAKRMRAAGKQAKRDGAHEKQGAESAAANAGGETRCSEETGAEGDGGAR